MSSFFNFFATKYFWFNFIAAGLVVLMILGLTYRWLDSYTNHGESISVPDLTGKNVKELEQFLSQKNLRFSIADSSVFDLNLKPGTVIEQDPSPNDKVKEGRTVYVTITSTIAPEIKMPDLIDVSYRQAESILNSYGLKVGDIIYKPDLAKNAVLDIQLNGFSIKKGSLIAKGTTLDLVLGDGYGNVKVEVPDLYNLTLSEALFILKGSKLIAGKIEYDGTVVDSAEAKIYKQDPHPLDVLEVNQGDVIDLYLTASEHIIEQNLRK